METKITEKEQNLVDVLEGLLSCIGQASEFYKPNGEGFTNQVLSWEDKAKKVIRETKHN